MNDQKPNLKSFKTYRDKIFFRVILTTIALMLIDSPLAFVFAHPLASLLWEWWYFSFQKVKESAMLPQWYLEAKEITPEEVDNYIKFTVTARRLFALVGILLCLISGYFLTNWELAIAGAFYGSFYLVRWLVILAAICRKDLKYPYNFFQEEREPIVLNMDDKNSNPSFADPRNPNWVGNPWSPFYTFRDK